MLRSLFSPTAKLTDLAQKKVVWSALLIGAGGFYWKTLPLSERLLPPQKFDVTFVFLNLISALMYLGVISLLIQGAFYLCGQSVKHKLHSIFFLWGWTEIPKLMLFLGVFYANYFIPGFIVNAFFDWRWMAAAGIVLLAFCVWYLLFKIEALKVCYGLTGRKLLAPVVLIFIFCGGFNLLLLNTLEETAWIKLTDLRPMISKLDLKMVSKLAKGPLFVDPYIPIATVPVRSEAFAFHRGDIVTYVSPKEGTTAPFAQRIFFKPRHLGRIIGLPGETLELVKSWIKINGEALIEPYVLHKQNYDYAPTKIPAQQFFIAGDNRLMYFTKYSGGLIKQARIVGIFTPVSGIMLKLFTPREEEQEPLEFEEEKSQREPEKEREPEALKEPDKTSAPSE